MHRKFGTNFYFIRQDTIQKDKKYMYVEILRNFRMRLALNKTEELGERTLEIMDLFSDYVADKRIYIIRGFDVDQFFIRFPKQKKKEVILVAKMIPLKHAWYEGEHVPI